MKELELGVLKLDFHLRAGVLLEGDNAILKGAGVFINHLGEDVTVDFDCEMRAIGDNHQLISSAIH